MTSPTTSREPHPLPVGHRDPAGAPPPMTHAVIFGGPSPEHDVSILTGLQAVRALAGGGGAPLALYWSKGGEWFQVDADLEAEAFLDGIPRKALPLRFV